MWSRDDMGEHLITEDSLWLARWPALCRLARSFGLPFVGVSRATLIGRVMAAIRHSRRMHERARELAAER